MGRQAANTLAEESLGLVLMAAVELPPHASPLLAQFAILDLKFDGKEKSENVHLRTLRCDARFVIRVVISAGSAGLGAVLERARPCIPGVYIARGCDLSLLERIGPSCWPAAPSSGIGFEKGGTVGAIADGNDY